MMTTAHTYINAINVVRDTQFPFGGRLQIKKSPRSLSLGRRVFYSVKECIALQTRGSIAYQRVSKNPP
jgi:hypothetical protein